MNKHEAYQILLSGQLVTCSYFNDSEYLCYNEEKDQIQNEKGFHIHNFWSNNYLFGVKWSIY